VRWGTRVNRGQAQIKVSGGSPKSGKKETCFTEGYGSRRDVGHHRHMASRMNSRGGGGSYLGLWSHHRWGFSFPGHLRLMTKPECSRASEWRGYPSSRQPLSSVLSNTSRSVTIWTRDVRLLGHSRRDCFCVRKNALFLLISTEK